MVSKQPAWRCTCSVYRRWKIASTGKYYKYEISLHVCVGVYGRWNNIISPLFLMVLMYTGVETGNRRARRIGHKTTCVGCSVVGSDPIWNCTLFWMRSGCDAGHCFPPLYLLPLCKPTSLTTFNDVKKSCVLIEWCLRIPFLLWSSNWQRDAAKGGGRLDLGEAVSLQGQFSEQMWSLFGMLEEALECLQWLTTTTTAALIRWGWGMSCSCLWDQLVSE